MTEVAKMPPGSEEEGISKFLGLVGEMLSRSDFLLPLAAGQRQFRQDNYNMASAALLEDLFYDALGMYLRENHPTTLFERRTGKELWDYALDGLQLSHKETLTRDIAVWWTAGDQVEGKYVPKPQYQSFSAKHPIVLVYSGCPGLQWSSDTAGVAVHRRDGSVAPRTGRLMGPLGIRAISGQRDTAGDHTLLLARQLGDSKLEVERAWSADEWRGLTFHDLWPSLGGPSLGTRDLWLDRRYRDSRTGLSAVVPDAVGATLTLDGNPLLPGMYVIPSGELQGVPMVANNRAHSIAPAAVSKALDNARQAGRYLEFPTWFAHFADAPPPNLYGRQRAQYEELFAARQRPTTL